MNEQKNIKLKKIEVSIIIVSYNVKKYLIQCIESILAHTNVKFKYEIIVIDNNSSDHTRKEVKERFTKEQKQIFPPNNC